MRSDHRFHCYHGFGLSCYSELVLPELTSANDTADFVIQYGSVPTTLSASPSTQEDCRNPTEYVKRSLYEISQQQFLLNLSEFAGVRYLVEDGQRITIESLPHAEEDQVRLFLLSTCLAVLFYQRNLFPLHGSAIQTAQGSVIFTGDSGSGKSTLAAALCQRGYPILTDDISVFQRDHIDRFLLMPGVPWLKLWTDAAEQIKQKDRLKNPVQPDLDKYWLPLGEQFAANPTPPHTIFILQPDNHDDIRMEAVHGIAKVAPLQLNAYRHQLALEMGKEPLLFQQASRLANQVRVYRIRRPRHHFLLAELVDRIIDILET